MSSLVYIFSVLYDMPSERQRHLIVIVSSITLHCSIQDNQNAAQSSQMSYTGNLSSSGLLVAPSR